MWVWGDTAFRYRRAKPSLEYELTPVSVRPPKPGAVMERAAPHLQQAAEEAIQAPAIHRTAMVPSAARRRSGPAVATANAANGTTQVNARLPPTAATAKIAGHNHVTRYDESAIGAVPPGVRPAVGESAEKPCAIIEQSPFMRRAW